MRQLQAAKLIGWGIRVATVSRVLDNVGKGDQPTVNLCEMPRSDASTSRVPRQHECIRRGRGCGRR
jgi:hypothetical protein